jgi:hypothetical protein
MGQQSKATQARRSNFGRPTGNNPQNPTVEDASNDEDSDLYFEDNNLREHGFFILDDEFP